MRVVFAVEFKMHEGEKNFYMVFAFLLMRGKNLNLFGSSEPSAELLESADQ